MFLFTEDANWYLKLNHAGHENVPCIFCHALLLSHLKHINALHVSFSENPWRIMASISLREMMLINFARYDIARGIECTYDPKKKRQLLKFLR